MSTRVLLHSAAICSSLPAFLARTDSRQCNMCPRQHFNNPCSSVCHNDRAGAPLHDAQCILYAAHCCPASCGSHKPASSLHLWLHGAGGKGHAAQLAASRGGGDGALLLGPALRVVDRFRICRQAGNGRSAVCTFRGFVGGGRAPTPAAACGDSCSASRAASPGAAGRGWAGTDL